MSTKKILIFFDIVRHRQVKLEIIDLIGQGRFGKIYKVKEHLESYENKYRKPDGNTITTRLYLIKELQLPAGIDDYPTEKESFIKRFIQEAKILVNLEHSNIVAGHYLQNGSKNYFYSMQFIVGNNLRIWRKKLGLKIDIFQVLDLILFVWQICDALAYLDKHNVIHRDIKPTNIMIKGGEKKAVIIDFGAAKVRNDRLQAANTTPAEIAFLGTDGYKPPEWYQHFWVGPKSDIYSLGVALFETITQANPLRKVDDYKWCRNAALDISLPYLTNKDIPALILPQFDLISELNALIQGMTTKIYSNRWGMDKIIPQLSKIYTPLQSYLMNQME